MTDTATLDPTVTDEQIAEKLDGIQRSLNEVLAAMEIDGEVDTSLIGKIGHEVAKVVVDPVKKVVEPVEQRVKDDVKRGFTTIIKPLMKPPLPGLERTLKSDIASVDHFASVVSDTVTSEHLLKLIQGPANARRSAPPREDVLSVLAAVVGLLDELDAHARELLKGKSLPAIPMLKKMIDIHKQYIEGFEQEIWSLLQIPEGLVDFKDLSKLLEERTEELKWTRQASASGSREDAEVASWIVRLLCDIVAEFCGWLAAGIPLGVSVGADAGIAAGFKIGADGSLNVWNPGTLVFGGIGGFFKILAEIGRTIAGIDEALRPRAIEER